MFRVRPERYWVNRYDSELLHAGEATLDAGTTAPEPAVALFHDRYVKFVLNGTEARRLAAEILYKLEVAERHHQTQTTKNHEGNNQP